MKRLMLAVICFFTMVSFTSAYDTGFNFKQQYSELVAGWYIDAGPTKGGPYPNPTDCVKTAAKADGSFDCKATGWTANPAYFVITPYNSAKVKIAGATSPEQTVTVTVPPPTDIKTVVTVTVVSKLTRYGNIIAESSVDKITVPIDKDVKLGVVANYRAKDGRYIFKYSYIQQG